MKKIFSIILIQALMLTSLGVYAAKKKTDDVRVTVTFLVMMDRDTNAKISKALKAQDGIINSKIDTQKQEVVITFDGKKNTVSNLQQMFKENGYTAQALETGCFGSPEGCLNAVHYIENTMP
ncbi:MAG: cation transporter [Paludibacteraceae bacterium]|nr:cation transporter [Paludibacteraceae bacterium]